MDRQSGLPQSEGCSFKEIFHESGQKDEVKLLPHLPKEIFVWKYDNLPGMGIWQYEIYCDIILKGSP